MPGPAVPGKAMVLAAGLGKRMRPLTLTTPKPLIEVSGKPLIDWSLDLLAAAGVGEAVVNVHYLGDRLIGHLRGRDRPAVIISDERGMLLDSAGGIVKALPLFGDEPFFVVNADTFWIDRAAPSLQTMAQKWDARSMDMLMLLSSPRDAVGHGERTDFLIDADGRLKRSGGAAGGYIYAGALIVDPVIFKGASAEPHSLNAYFDRSIRAGRLYGTILNGTWITVGTPDAIAPAEAAVAAAGSAVR